MSELVKGLEGEAHREVSLLKRLGSWAVTALLILLLIAFISGFAIGRSTVSCSK